jgi:hypothetical protein
MAFLPLPDDFVWYGYGNVFLTPFEDTFTRLDERIEPGDVVYIDASCEATYELCGTQEEWDYYQMVYFPDRRLHIVDSLEAAEAARRVWYVHVSGWHDKQVQAQITEGRVQSTFFGPWDFLWQLYEAPPDREGVLYENGMRFHGFDIIDPRLGYGYVTGSVVRREGEAVILRLWWSVDEALEQDYSISTVIATAPDAPPLVQVDNPPQTINLFAPGDIPPPQTSLWQAGQYYVEERVLPIPADVDSALRNNPLTIYMTLYQWWDGATIDAPHVYETGRRRLRDMYILAY